MHSHRKLFGGNGVMRRGALAYNHIPWANEEYLELRGAKVFALNGGVAGVFGTVGKINLNDLTTPWINAATTSRPPYGNPEFSARYAKYKITGCHIKLTMVSSNSPSAVLACAPVCSTDTYTFGGESPEKTLEKPGTAYKMGNTMPASGTTALSAPETLEWWLTVQQVEGLTAVQFKADNGNYAANFGASPASRPYLAMAVGDLGGVSTPGVSFLAEVVWYGFAYERVLTTAS